MQIGGRAQGQGANQLVVAVKQGVGSAAARAFDAGNQFALGVEQAQALGERVIPARQALGRIIGPGRVRTYTVASPVKKAVVGVIIAQLVVRSIAVAF